MKRWFTIHKGDVGSEAYRDEYVKRIESDILVVEAIARKAPELNPCNYTHDQVCELNAAMCELYEVVREYAEQRPATASDEGEE